MRRLAIAARSATPMSTTIVPPTRAKRLPVGLVLVAEAAMAGDDGDARRHAALRDGHASGGRRGERGGDARHHLERHARSPQGEGLLAAPAEQERVATLQPHDARVLLRELDQEVVDELLRDRTSGALADVDALDVPGHEREHLGVRERVVHDDVSGREQPRRRAG